MGDYLYTTQTRIADVWLQAYLQSRSIVDADQAVTEADIAVTKYKELVLATA